MTYRVDIRPAAVKQLRKLDPKVRRRVDAAIMSLAYDPHPAASERLTSREAQWQFRVGDWRILYDVLMTFW